MKLSFTTNLDCGGGGWVLLFFIFIFNPLFHKPIFVLYIMGRWVGGSQSAENISSHLSNKLKLNLSLAIRL